MKAGAPQFFTPGASENRVETGLFESIPANWPKSYHYVIKLEMVFTHKLLMNLYNFGLDSPGPALQN